MVNVNFLDVAEGMNEVEMNRGIRYSGCHGIEQTWEGTCTSKKVETKLVFYSRKKMQCLLNTTWIVL